MDIKIELILVTKIFLALVLGGLIGLERERHGSAAGIRTYAAVSLGAALFTLIGIHSSDETAGGRIVANIVTGIGFLGAGIIYRNSEKGMTHGLTTASTVWATAAVGVAVAYNMFVIAIIASLAIYFLLALHHMQWYIKLKKKWAQKNLKQPDNNDENE